MNKYRNFYLISDENTVIKNPHKGFYFHYLDNGYTRPIYRDEENLEAILPSFPGMNHLYLRFDWGDIEKEKGVFDWSYIDEIIDKYRKLGFRFSLRLCTYETNGVTPYAIPEWLAKKIDGTFVELRGKTLFEPKYDDEVFLGELDRFMAEYGKKFDGRSDIEYVDIGTFGTYGEGHTSSGSGKQFSPETIKKHIDLHLKNFPNTQIIINDDMLTHVFNADRLIVSEMIEYCVGKGIGIRDDGICVDYYSKTFGYATLRNPDWFSEFTRYSPCDIELAHYNVVPDEHFKDGLPYLEAIRQTKATFSGFHGYAVPWLEKNRYLTDYLANRLGYFYFIDGIEIPSPISGSLSLAKVRISNKGFSKAYHRFNLEFFAEQDGRLFLLNDESPDNRCWNSESTNTETIRFDFRQVPSGDYRLLVKMTDVKSHETIKLGIKEEEMLSDGSYALDRFEVTHF